MFFIATFGTRHGNLSVETETQTGNDKRFLVEANDIGAAETYAKRFENIATDWQSALTCVKQIEEAKPEDIDRLINLSFYEQFFPDR
jgi:hypothetical protein